MQQINRAALRQLSGAGPERLLHNLEWQNFRLPPSTTKETKWLVVSTKQAGESLANQVISRLSEQGHAAVEVSLQDNAEFEQPSESHFTICPKVLANWERLFEESPAPDGIAWILDGDSESNGGSELPKITELQCTGLLNLIATLHKHNLKKLECGLQLITHDAVAINDAASVDANQSQYWGFGRVLGAEHPEMRCRLIDLASEDALTADTVNHVVDILLTETHDSQLAVRSGQFSVPRLKQAAVPRKLGSQLHINSDASYLITGGLGMLGRQAAKWLAEQGAKQVVLVSRRDPDHSTQQFLNTIESLGCEVVVQSASLSSADDVKNLFERFGKDLKPLAGVIHAAGVLDDGLIGAQTWERFEKVLAPKVVGARLLHEFTKSMSLDFFILYSSAASVLGSPGQSNYATANAFLDGLAWQRRALGLPALSINWGPWTEGMADDERILKRLALQGITPLAVSEAHEAMAKNAGCRSWANDRHGR